RPEAGMFFWYSLTSDEDGDSKELIEKKAYEGGVLALPGAVFLPNGRKTALQRLRVVILKERGRVNS
ncbi:hypothetical protein EDC04DRAFT_2829532, partial [Pisolithus marmoratus]